MKFNRRVAPILVTWLWAVPACAFDSSNIVPGSGTVEFAFAPDDDAAGMVMRAIDAARVQVLVQAFSFTHEPIAAALVRARRRGLDVQVLADPEQIELAGRNAVGLLRTGAVPVFADGAHLAAHNKVVIIDARSQRPVLVTGSFNFTFAAQYRNAENLLVFRDNHELTRAYLENWERHRAHSSPLGADTGR